VQTQLSADLVGEGLIKEFSVLKGNPSFRGIQKASENAVKGFPNPER